MRDNYTVISFGNYETKILICTFIDNTLFPIYKKSFLTKNCFQESEIIDEELLVETLNKKFRNLPIKLKDSNLILNVPIKTLDIVNSSKEGIPVSSGLTRKMLFEFFESFGQVNIPSDKVQLDKKVICWKINNKFFSYIPELPQNLSTFGWNLNIYLAKKALIERYKFIFTNYFNIHPQLITCDSLVMNQLFSNKERKSKVLVNIGHLKSSFERYESEVLVNQTSYDFGIRHLTAAIGKMGGIDEIKSIELLKIYKKISTFDQNLALINHFKEKYLDYTQTTIKDIDKLIFVWIKDLVSLLNYYLRKSKLNFLGLDEIYIYSSMNILDSWFPFMKENLDKRVEIFAIKPNLFSIHESKFCSLIATVLQYVKNQDTSDSLTVKIG